jgi:peptidoglycan-N-acetylglucosamine deacetylase
MRRLCMTGMTSVAIVCLAAAQSSAPTVSVTRWPQDHAAAISLTFDDGINTHLDGVGPILKKHHLHGTFFVTTGMGPWEKRKSEWKQLADQGNELGNHTVHHPCLLPQITPHSQDYTPEMMETEIRDAAREIAQLTNSQRGMTFAYPCGNMSFGKPQEEVKNSVLYLQYVSAYSFGARAVGSGADSPEELNVLAINALGVTADKDFPALLDLAQPALRGNNWGVYCFHGVGGDWLSVTPAALDRLASYLETHGEIWTAPFGDVLRYVQERKAASIRIEQSDANSVSIALAWPMDQKIYDLPLTLKVEISQSWSAASGSGDGKPLPVALKNTDKGTVLLLEVPPQTANVTIANKR